MAREKEAATGMYRAEAWCVRKDRAGAEGARVLGNEIAATPRRGRRGGNEEKDTWRKPGATSKILRQALCPQVVSPILLAT